MSDLKQWRYVDTYTLVEAVALIIGINPDDAVTQTTEDSDQRVIFDEPVYKAMARALEDGKMSCQKAGNLFAKSDVEKIKEARKEQLCKSAGIPSSGKLIRQVAIQPLPAWRGAYEGISINLAKSEPVLTFEEIQKWLESKGESGGFFFPEKPQKPAPEYLNHLSPYYSPKLAATVKAWEAVSSDDKYHANGKTVKQNLLSWLKEHAEEYSLTDQAQKEIAKIANWNTDGGAPKTPGQ